MWTFTTYCYVNEKAHFQKLRHNPILVCVQREVPGIFTTKMLAGVCNRENNRLLGILPQHEEFLHRAGGPLALALPQREGEQLLTVHPALILAALTV